MERLRREVLNPMAEAAAKSDLKNYRELFQLPLGLAVLCLLAKVWLGSDRRSAGRKIPAIRQKPVPE